MARVTTILAMSLMAVTALASSDSNLVSGGASIEENESGLEGLRQSATRSMADVEAAVGKTPYQQPQQLGGTGVAIIAASITPAPKPILNSRQLPAPLPNPGGGRNNPLPSPDTGSAQSALASLSAQSSADVAKASSAGFESGSAVAAAQASSQIASISASLAASLSSAIASITATATPAQQLPPATVTVTQTVNPIVAPGQQLPSTVTVTQTQIQTQTQTQTEIQTVNPSLTSPAASTTATMNVAQSDLLPILPTTSNALISDPAKNSNQVDLTVGQLAAVIIGTIIATALGAVFLTLLFTRYAQRRKVAGQVYTIGPDDSGSQTALRTAYAGDEKSSSLPPTEQHPAVRTKSLAPDPSQSQRTSAYDERASAGAETAGFGFGPFRWSNVRNSIFGGPRPQGSRPDSQQVEVRTAHKRTISNGSKPRLIRLGSRDDKLTPVTEGSRESPAGIPAPPGQLNIPSGPPSRQPSASPLNLNPPNAPFRNPSGDAVSWGSWGAMVQEPQADGHMAVLLKEPPRHQHNLSTSTSGSSKIMDANQLAAVMAADGAVERPPPTRQPSKHERRPSSGTLGVMGGGPSSTTGSRLEGPPSMPHPLPSFGQYEQRQMSYWSPTDTTVGTDSLSPISSIGALKAFPQVPEKDRRSVHGRVQSMSSSRYSTATVTTSGGLARNPSQRSVDSSHRRSASVNSFLLTSSTIHTNGATFSLFSAPNHDGDWPPPVPSRSYSSASSSSRGARNPAPRAISAVAPPMPPLALGGLPTPPPLPRGNSTRRGPQRGSDMV